MCGMACNQKLNPSLVIALMHQVKWSQSTGRTEDSSHQRTIVSDASWGGIFSCQV